MINITHPQIFSSRFILPNIHLPIVASKKYIQDIRKNTPRIIDTMSARLAFASVDICTEIYPIIAIIVSVKMCHFLISLIFLTLFRYSTTTNTPDTHRQETIDSSEKETSRLEPAYNIAKAYPLKPI
jgi:hypothetical protein